MLADGVLHWAGERLRTERRMRWIRRRSSARAARLGLRSRGRIDFGIDYRLEDGLVLGFESFYSGLGRNELESYGAGLDLRLEF